MSSGKSNKSSKGIKRKEKEEDKATHSGLGKSETNDKRVCSGGKEFEVSDSPLLTLVKAAATINPTQFALPTEMLLPSSFPGEAKRKCLKSKNISLGNITHSSVAEDVLMDTSKTLVC